MIGTIFHFPPFYISHFGEKYKSNDIFLKGFPVVRFFGYAMAVAFLGTSSSIIAFPTPTRGDFQPIRDDVLPSQENPPLPANGVPYQGSPPPHSGTPYQGNPPPYAVPYQGSPPPYPRNPPPYSGAPYPGNPPPYSVPYQGNPPPYGPIRQPDMIDGEDIDDVMPYQESPPPNLQNRKPLIVNRKDVKEAVPGQKVKPAGSSTNKPQKAAVTKATNKTSGKKKEEPVAKVDPKTTAGVGNAPAKGVKILGKGAKSQVEADKAQAEVAKPPVKEESTIPAKLRPLTKKTIVIDARRLDENRFTETIRYIKENPNVRLKLQNTSINPEFVVKILKGIKESGVIDQIREIGFVMLPGGDENLILNEKAFTEKVLPYLGHLEGIELSCLGVTDKVLEAISKKAPHLKSVSLFGVGITDKSVANLAKTLPNLTKLHLINTSVTTKSIPLLVKEFPYLRALGISGQHFKDADYIALKDGMANILSFSAVGQKFERMSTIREILMAMPKLHTLDLSESPVTDEAAKAIAEVPKGLQNLNISETQITFEGVKDIVKSRDLIKLKMNNLRGIRDEELGLIIERQPGLKVFHFSGAYFTDATIMTLILNLRKLIDVTLIPAKQSTWVLTEGVEKALALKKAKLQYLHIQANRLPAKLLQDLEKEVPKLRIEYVA
jgi:hypothetical protein